MKKTMTGMGSLWEEKWVCNNMKNRQCACEECDLFYITHLFSACRKGREYGEMENVIDRLKYEVKV